MEQPKNGGCVYRDRLTRSLEPGTTVLSFYTTHHPHFSATIWSLRIRSGTAAITQLNRLHDKKKCAFYHYFNLILFNYYYIVIYIFLPGLVRLDGRLVTDEGEEVRSGQVLEYHRFASCALFFRTCRVETVLCFLL
jgi:hypothetical protein